MIKGKIKFLIYKNFELQIKSPKLLFKNKMPKF